MVSTSSRPMMYATLDDWIAREAAPFSTDSPDEVAAAVDKVVAELGDGVEMLGFGEALHGGEAILVLRNRLFQWLAEAHGYSAIAIESSFPRARVVNEYVAGRGAAAYEAVQETGFGHAFGRLDANRELVEWMRRHNADPSRRVELRFYGFDIPTGTNGIASPRQVLHFVADYVASVDPAAGRAHRERIDSLLGDDANWENPAAMMDPAQAIGLSPAATALRIETEDLVSEMRARRPEFMAKSGEPAYAEALHYASMARQLLNFHASMARVFDQARYARLSAIRDALMAGNLTYVASRERGRGKVLVFAHNEHLKRGMARWQSGTDVHTWWPAGSHLHELFGRRYAVIGSAVGVSEANGIGEPEPGTLEARLTAAPGPARFIPTHGGEGLPAEEIAALPTRAGSAKNPTYFPLNPRAFAEFDWLAVLDATAYNRGGPPLHEWDASASETSG
ncbi:MAG: erythromycin esterase family protein [Chloroflexota bacterium]|nr:erythromycin esterase family protein [Chloroflexota bacterium]